MAIYSLQAVADFVTIEAPDLQQALDQAPLAILERGVTIFINREYSDEEIKAVEKEKGWEPEFATYEWPIGKELEEWYRGNVLPSQN